MSDNFETYSFSPEWFASEHTYQRTVFKVQSKYLAP